MNKGNFESELIRQKQKDDSSHCFSVAERSFLINIRHKILKIKIVYMFFLFIYLFLIEINRLICLFILDESDDSIFQKFFCFITRR